MHGFLILAMVSSLSFTRHTVGNLSYTHDVAAADLDGDGDQDVVGAGRSSAALVWFEWTGPDSFTPHTVFSASEIIGCWAGDLDKDGDNDLAVASRDYLAWFENNGTGSFTQHTLISNANCGWRVNAADVDSDGDSDLLFTDWTGSSLYWFENDGSMSFSSHLVDGSLSGAHEVWGLDLDADGDCDLIGTEWATGNVYWYRNNGSETFTKLLVGNSGIGSNGCWDAMPYDIDGDGDPDIAASNYGGYVAWFENDGAGNWTKHDVDNAFGGSVHGICVADFNKSGGGDIIACGYGGAIKGYEYSGWVMTSIDMRTGPLPVYPHDMDGDGDPDFVLGADGSVYWYENTLPAAVAEEPGRQAPELTALFRAGALSVRFLVPSGQGFSLRLYSADGRMIQELESGQGTGQLAERTYGLEISRGIYYLALGTGEETRSVPVVR